MNLRIIIPAAIAGLSTLGAALAEPGEWTTPRILRIVALAAVAALVVFHKEAGGAPATDVLAVFRRVAAREITPEDGARLLYPGSMP